MQQLRSIKWSWSKWWLWNSSDMSWPRLQRVIHETGDYQKGTYASYLVGGDRQIQALYKFTSKEIMVMMRVSLHYLRCHPVCMCVCVCVLAGRVQEAPEEEVEVEKSSGPASLVPTRAPSTLTKEARSLSSSFWLKHIECSSEYCQNTGFSCQVLSVDSVRDAWLCGALSCSSPAPLKSNADEVLRLIHMKTEPKTSHRVFQWWII